jgi:hypothetical protein
MATKLYTACYALRNRKHIIPQSTLQTIYYAHIHSILSHGIIFWGRSSNVSKLFILQKRIIRIITNTGVRESCREAFKNLEIMAYSQYIFSLILFAVKKKHLFTSSKEIHTYKTRNYLNFHLPTVSLTKFYKGPYVSGTKAFSHLPWHIKILVSDMKCFKLSLKRFLCHHSFYSVEEYYEHIDDKHM